MHSMLLVCGVYKISYADGYKSVFKGFFCAFLVEL